MPNSQDESRNLPTVSAALTHCHTALDEAPLFYGHGTDNAWDEAVQLVLCAARLPVDAGDEVLDEPLDKQARTTIAAWLEQRIVQRIPLPYLTGRAWFAGVEFLCDKRAIVPRSPIAELIEDSFSPWYAGPSPRRVLDLCCGGGCMGLATALHLPEVQVDLVDIDERALALAAENRERLQLADRVEIVSSDLFTALDKRRYDLVLCNPPYVDALDLAAMPTEFEAEPALSLGSGEDGLDLTRRILARVGEFLTSSGMLVMEVGYSWPALEKAFPSVAFTWVEFSRGGEGVFVMSAAEWEDYSESFRR